MQLPISLLDQRLVQDGTLARLKDAGIEVHARSAFLQGLLFLPRERLPAKLAHIAEKLEAVRRRVAEAGATPLSAALAFCLARDDVDVTILGVTSIRELDEIVTSATAAPPHLDWKACAIDDPLVLTPSLW
jgi:aryl-alcohol dehydrogenase-like predicted oxidoreductase